MAIVEGSGGAKTTKKNTANIFDNILQNMQKASQENATKGNNSYGASRLSANETLKANNKNVTNNIANNVSSLVDKAKTSYNVAKTTLGAVANLKKTQQDVIANAQAEQKAKSDASKLDIATNKTIVNGENALKNKDLKEGLTSDQIKTLKNDSYLGMVNASNMGDTKSYQSYMKDYAKYEQLEKDTQAANDYLTYQKIMSEGTDEEKQNYNQMLINSENTLFEDIKLANESSYNKLVASISKEASMLTNNQDLSEYATKMLEESDKNLNLALSGRDGLDALALKYFGGNQIQLTGDALMFFINPTSTAGKVAMWGAETLGDVLQAAGESRIRLEQQGYDESQINANVLGNAIITAAFNGVSRYTNGVMLNKQLNNNPFTYTTFAKTLSGDAVVKSYNALETYLLKKTGSEVATNVLSATGRQFFNVLGKRTAKTLLNSETLGGDYAVENVNDAISKVWNGGEFVVDELMSCLMTAISVYKGSSDIYDIKEKAYDTIAKYATIGTLNDPNAIKSMQDYNTAISILNYFKAARESTTDYTNAYDDIIAALEIQISNYAPKITNISTAISSTNDNSIFNIDLGDAKDVGLYSIQPNVVNEMQSIKDSNNNILIENKNRLFDEASRLGTELGIPADKIQTFATDYMNMSEAQKTNVIKNEYSKSVPFEDSIKLVKSGEFAKQFGQHTRVTMRKNTPQVLIENVPGVKDLRMTIGTGHIKTITGGKSSAGNTHYLTDEILAKVPKAMEHPIAIYKHKELGSINEVLDLKDVQGRNIIVAIIPNSQQKVGVYDYENGSYNIEFVDCNNVKTTFGIGDNGLDVTNYINNKVGEFYYPTNMTKEKLNQLVGGENRHLADSTSDYILPNEPDFVNNKNDNYVSNNVPIETSVEEQAQIIADNDDFNYSVEQLIEESKAPNSQLIKTHINENTINALKAAGYDGFVNEYDPTKYPNVLEYGVFDIKQISNNKANKKVNYDKQLVDLLSNPYGNDELREYLKNKYNKSDENIEKAIILRDSLNVSNNDQLDYEKSLQKLSREIVDNKTVVKGLTNEQIADFNNLTPTNKYTSGLSTEDSKVVTKARKMIKQQMVDKSRRLNVKNELNQVVADIYQTGDITEQTYNSLREKIVDSTLIKVPNDEYGIKTDIINNYMNGTPFLKKDGWDNTIQEIQDKYNVFAQDNYPLTYEDAKNSLKDYFDSIGDKYIYYTPVQMGMMSQGDYDNMLINTVADVINELKFNINNVDMDDKALVEFTNERLSSKEANLIDKLLINDTLGNNDYVNNVLDYIRRNNTNQEVMEGAISSSEDSLQDLIKNESKYIDTIVEKDGIASLPTETLDKMEADSLEYITLDKVKDQETKVLENKKYKKKGTNLKEDINKMKQKIIDRGQAIYDLGRKTKSDIYAYYNNYRNAASMADYKLYQDKNNWVDIIKKIPKDQQNDFSYMMYHWLNTDTYKYKKPVFGDITDKQSQQIVDQYLKEHPDWKDVAQKVWDYEKDLREELVKHGRISRQTADTWEEMYPHYVHIVRDSVNVDEVPNVLETEQEKVKSSNKGTVKERTGGNSALKSLNDAIVEQTKQVYSATTMNDFINRYVQVAKPKVQVWEDFQDRTIEGIDRSIGNEIQAPDENTPATFIFYDNGDTRTIEVPANIYDAFVAEKVMDNVVTDVLSKANEIRRNLITSQNITFAARNIIKDTQDVLLKSEHPTLTYTMMPKAAVDMATNSETYQLYRSMGGGRNNATKVTEGSKIYNKTIGMVERGNNFVETLPRYAEFKASLASGRTPIQAMYDADKVTTNFKMGGDYTKFADRNGFTFLNASVEGFTELARDYQSVYDKKGWKGVLGKLAMATLVFNVPLMVANHLRWKDDEDYQNLSDYVKDNYYILWKNKDGSFTRINKGRVAAAYQAIISTLWENGVELVSDDSATEKAKFMWENSLDGLERVWDNIGINNPLKNNIVSPIIDVMKNETWYGEDLLSEYQLKKDASEQYDYTTDALSKWIGQNTNTSPIKWNYLLEQYSGGIGDIVLPTLTPKAETNLDDGTALGKVESALLSPIVDDFTVDPVFKNQNVSDLFDLDTELSKRASKDSATDEEKIASKYISNIKYQMFKLYGQRADIFNDETLTDAEKYRQARLIQGQINELAKYGLNTYDNIDMSGGYTQVGDLSYYKNSENEWEKVNADTIEEMESLGMTTDQRNTYYQLKEEITGNNQVQTLLGYYDSLEELKNSNKYSSTMKKNKISELEEKIKKAESKFTSEELAQIKKDGTINARTNNYEAIKSSNLSDEQKNYMYDKYYSSNLNEYINELDISDSEKLDLKYTTSQVEGKKNAKGKTISNSKALAMADAYADAGVLDDVFAYIKENNLDPSDFGLSKKVYNYSYKQLENAYKNIFGQDFGTGDTIEDTSVIDSSYYGTSGSSSSSTDKARKKQLKAMKAYMNAITSANKNIFSYLNNMTSIEDAKSNVNKIKSKYKV